jgi:putative phosphoribosyl transferase
MTNQSELAIGAIGENGARYLNVELIDQAGISPDAFATLEQRERGELERWARIFRGESLRLSLFDRAVLIVDDGVATGATARAACQVARIQGVKRLVLATPVSPVTVLQQLDEVADEIVCLETPEPLVSVGDC